MVEFYRNIKKLNERFMYCVYLFTIMFYTAYLRYVYALILTKDITDKFGLFFAGVSGAAIGIAFLLIVTKDKDNLVLIVNTIIHLSIVIGKLIYAFMHLSVFWNRSYISIAMSLNLLIIFIWRLNLSHIRRNALTGDGWDA